MKKLQLQSTVLRQNIAIHVLLMYTASELLVDPAHPFLGASADGIVHCSCCGKGILEVKFLTAVKIELSKMLV